MIYNRKLRKKQNKIYYRTSWWKCNHATIISTLFQKYFGDSHQNSTKNLPKNLENYQKYKEVLKRNAQEKNYEKVEKWREPIILQIQKGQKETRVLQ
jgi:hypothetical protein